MDAPVTVTEAIALLRDRGYTDDIEVNGPHAECARIAASVALSKVEVDHTFRFEGDSDPGDEMIVLGLRFPGTAVKGVLVSAYGYAADPETAEFFANLHST